MFVCIPYSIYDYNNIGSIYIQKKKIVFITLI